MGEKSPQRKVMNTSVYASPANSTAPTFTLLVPGLGPLPFPGSLPQKISATISGFILFSQKSLFLILFLSHPHLFFSDFILSQCKVNSSVFQYTRKIANKSHY